MGLGVISAKENPQFMKTPTYLPGRGIKNWAADDRPREKLLHKKALSDVELLALLIGSGNSSHSAVDISRNVLGSVSNNLAELARMDVSQLTRFRGIGFARASNIVAAMELGRRRRLGESLRKQAITSSRDAFELMHPIMAELAYEEFWIVALNRGNRIIRPVRISEGSVSGTVADPKKIFRLALENNASAVILCHNHPSGQCRPSANDERITKQCVAVGKQLDLVVLDHLIIAHDLYYSFADENMI